MMRINLTNEVRDFYTENYKTSLKQIKDLKKMDFCSQTARLNIVEMVVCLKVI